MLICIQYTKTKFPWISLKVIHVHTTPKHHKCNIMKTSSIPHELGLAVGLDEVESVKEFGAIMAKRGVWNWWRRGMGYA
jgi:hypothetical protein